MGETGGKVRELAGAEVVKLGFNTRDQSFTATGGARMRSRKGWRRQGECDDQCHGNV